MSIGSATSFVSQGEKRLCLYPFQRFPFSWPAPAASSDSSHAPSHAGYHLKHRENSLEIDMGIVITGSDTLISGQGPKKGILKKISGKNMIPCILLLAPSLKNLGTQGKIWGHAP